MDINYNTSGDKTVIAAVAGSTIRIHRITLYCNASNTLTLKDGTTAIMGAFAFVANEGWEHDACDHCPIKLSDGNAFTLNLGSSAQVSGAVWYAQDITLNS